MKKILFLVATVVISCFSSISAVKHNKFSSVEVFGFKNEPYSLFKSADAKPFKVTIQMGSSFLNLSYSAGDTPSFDFTPRAGIRIESVFNNGVDVTNQLVDNIYTLAPITENILLLVTTVADSSTSTQLPELNFSISASNKKISIQNLAQGEKISLFDLTGKLLRSVLSTGEKQTLTVEKAGMYLVRIKNKSYKLVL